MATFLDLTNKVLRRLNEVTLTPATFANAVGFHAQAKDAVNASIKYIHMQRFEWPFMHRTGEQVLTIGENEYSFPADMKNVDWDTVYLKKDSVLGVTTKRLPSVDYDEWVQYHRDGDLDDAVEQYRPPEFVFRTQNGGFGISPMPNKAYTIGFEYFARPTDLNLDTDVTDIPDVYTPVIIDGGMYFAYLFRENHESAGMAKGNFDSGVKDMTRQLIKLPEYIRDTRAGPQFRRRYH
jgi:hypothetical protein